MTGQPIALNESRASSGLPIIEGMVAMLAPTLRQCALYGGVYMAPAKTPHEMTNK